MTTEDNSYYADKYNKYKQEQEKRKKLDERLENQEKDDRNPGPIGPIGPNKPLNEDGSGPGQPGRRRSFNPVQSSVKGDIVYLEPVKYNAANGLTGTAVVTPIKVTNPNGDIKNTGLQVVITKTGAFTSTTTSHKAQLALRVPRWDDVNHAWEHTDSQGHWVVKETIAAHNIRISARTNDSVTLQITDQRDISAVGSMMNKWSDTYIDDEERECMFLYILPLNYVIVRKKKDSIMEYFHDQDRSGANKDIMFIRESNCCSQQFAPSQWQFKEGSEVATWQGNAAITELVNSTSAWTNYGIYHNIIPTLDEIFE
tara:strand:- start:6113 stop:7051 length:939 start_codon:yes stop_codon:yes gene_type:complete